MTTKTVARTELYQEEIAKLLELLEIVDDTDSAPVIIRQIVNALAQQDVEDIEFKATPKAEAVAAGQVRLKNRLTPIIAKIEKAIEEWVPGDELEISWDIELSEGQQEYLEDLYRKVGWQVEVDTYSGSWIMLS